MNRSTQILSFLAGIGLIVGGIVLLNQSDPDFITTDEWQTLVEIYNHEIPLMDEWDEATQLATFNLATEEEVLDLLDERIITRVQNNNRLTTIGGDILTGQQYRNLVEGIMIRRNSANKEKVEALREVRGPRKRTFTEDPNPLSP